MRRAPIVAAGTVVGLVGVLSFHTSPAKLSLGSLGATTTSPTTTPATTPPAGQSGASTTTTVPAPTGTHTATGASVNYYFGTLAVSVTASGTKITHVSIGSINDGGNPRSQYIDQQSIPMLEQQALAAQSANIQGVSGASYTSAGFAQSLQSALGKLGI